ncbi:hypothetical protein GY15_00885 [Delftia sp. 670]|nr:hypothetical protein GY15_00885 [Delftia sp. 670]
MDAGALSSALNIEVHSGETGTRILKPCRSAGPAMGRVEEVICRKPLSQMRSMATRLAWAMRARIWAPSSPSMAFQTLS